MASTFKNAVASNVGTTPTDIYTVPAATATTVIGLSLANVAASGLVYVTVTMAKSGSSTVFLVKNAPVPQGGALVLFGGDQKLVMMAGDKVTVTSSAATSIDVALSYLEIA